MEQIGTRYCHEVEQIKDILRFIHLHYRRARGKEQIVKFQYFIIDFKESIALPLPQDRLTRIQFCTNVAAAKTIFQRGKRNQEIVQWISESLVQMSDLEMFEPGINDDD